MKNMSKPTRRESDDEEEPMYAAPIGPTRPGDEPMFIEDDEQEEENL